MRLSPFQFASFTPFMYYVQLKISTELHIDNQCVTNLIKNFQKKVLKKFANQIKSRTFVSGMRKQGSLDGIILLVISFSVINYVVSESVRL